MPAEEDADMIASNYTEEGHILIQLCHTYQGRHNVLSCRSTMQIPFIYTSAPNLQYILHVQSVALIFHHSSELLFRIARSAQLDL